MTLLEEGMGEDEGLSPTGARRRSSQGLDGTAQLVREGSSSSGPLGDLVFERLTGHEGGAGPREAPMEELANDDDAAAPPDQQLVEVSRKPPVTGSLSPNSEAEDEDGEEDDEEEEGPAPRLLEEADLSLTPRSSTGPGSMARLDSAEADLVYASEPCREDVDV